MRLTVNGQPESLPDGVTIADLLQSHSLEGAPCAVEVNRELIPKRQHATHRLDDGDLIEIVTLVGGG
mgnify:CR=1 FL=1